jgi:hypothetical protein
MLPYWSYTSKECFPAEDDLVLRLFRTPRYCGYARVRVIHAIAVSRTFGEVGLLHPERVLSAVRGHFEGVGVLTRFAGTHHLTHFHPFVPAFLLYDVGELTGLIGRDPRVGTVASNGLLSRYRRCSSASALPDSTPRGCSRPCASLSPPRDRRSSTRSCSCPPRRRCC